MSAKIGNTLARRALWIFTPLISLTIIAGVLLLFEHFFLSAQSLYLEQVALYAKERIARERVHFQLAESHLNKIQDSFVQRFNALDQPDYNARFQQLMQLEEDGSWRNAVAYNDLNEYSGNYIDDDTQVTDELKKKMVIFSDLTNQFGPGWHKEFSNLFIIGQENFISVYWPEVHWTRFLDTDVDLTEQKNYYQGHHAQIQSQPEKESLNVGHKSDGKAEWTGVYYDNVASKWLVSSIAPLKLNQQQIGTIGHDLYLNEMFQRTLNESYPGAFNFLFSHTGKVIVYPGLMEQLFIAEGQLDIQAVDLPLLTEAYDRVKTFGHSWHEYRSDRGDYFVVLSHLPEPDWFFATAYPMQELTAKAWKEAQLVLYLGAFLLAITLGMVYWLLHWQVGKPLQQFIFATHGIAQGDRNIYLDDDRDDELGNLATSFLKMQKAIRAQTSQLTREIHEKNLAQQQLEKAHHELQEINDQLELRVLQRTESLKLANDELSAAMRQLKDTQVQLVEAEKMSSLGSLVAGVAHEINTPVGICLTAASSMQDDLKALQKKYQNKAMTETDFSGYLARTDDTLQIMMTNNRRASELIRSFKQVAVDQSSEERRQFILKPYIDEVLLSLRPNLKKTRHKVSVHCEDDIVLDSYPGALFQVLTNLIMNSLIHGFDEHEQGEISLDIHHNEHELTLIYSDNGKGMDEDAVQKVFEPFYTTKRGEGGSGLGAHLIYNLVSQTLGGSIRCESTPGEGACFMISIPLVA